MMDVDGGQSPGAFAGIRTQMNDESVCFISAQQALMVLGHLLQKSFQPCK